jgi:16S rRNA (guanine527-N7)-methyltransferase
MDKKTFIEQIRIGFNVNNLSEYISLESAEKLYHFSELLVETNAKYNLTAITDPDGIILKHFIDSASVLKCIPNNASVVDIGCGAGFPSLPIAILRHDVTVKSIDSTCKKTEFVNQVANHLGLCNINAECGRAEELANVSRETFDVCVSRAVARLNILSELCIPFVKPDGSFIAMKSNKGKEELDEAKQGICKLGCQLCSAEEITLTHNGAEIEREIYVFQKKSQTPAVFPRNYSQICKKPL